MILCAANDFNMEDLLECGSNIDFATTSGGGGELGDDLYIDDADFYNIAESRIQALITNEQNSNMILMALVNEQMSQLFESNQVMLNESNFITSFFKGIFSLLSKAWEKIKSIFQSFLDMLFNRSGSSSSNGSSSSSSSNAKKSKTEEKKQVKTIDKKTAINMFANKVYLDEGYKVKQNDEVMYVITGGNLNNFFEDIGNNFELIDKNGPRAMLNMKIPDDFDVVGYIRGIIITRQFKSISRDEFISEMKKMLGLDKKVPRVSYSANDIIESSSQNYNKCKKEVEKMFNEYKKEINSAEKELKEQEKEMASMMNNPIFADAQKALNIVRLAITGMNAILTDSQYILLDAIKIEINQASQLAKKCIDMAVSQGYAIK